MPSSWRAGSQGSSAPARHKDLQGPRHSPAPVSDQLLTWIKSLCAHSCCSSFVSLLWASVRRLRPKRGCQPRRPPDGIPFQPVAAFSTSYRVGDGAELRRVYPTSERRPALPLLWPISGSAGPICSGIKAMRKVSQPGPRRYPCSGARPESQIVLIHSTWWAHDLDWCPTPAPGDWSENWKIGRIGAR